MCTPIWRITIAIWLSVAGLVSMTAPIAAGSTPEDVVFTRWWQRWDSVVEDGTVARTWIWGPRAGSSQWDWWAENPLLSAEPYDGHLRLVRYFDKARMEIPDLEAAADARPEDNLWLVTTGLLATELITGRLQLGDTHFEQHEPARIPVAGDVEGGTSSPTYADLTPLLDVEPLLSNTLVTQFLQDGRVGTDDRHAQTGVMAMDVGSPTGHTVASVFWTFMTSTGTVVEFVPELEDVSAVTEPLFPNAFYATGYPVTEPYWTRVTVAGTSRDVLLQCFERRCLTYTPDNPDGWQVEFGNIGQHYAYWRYALIPAETWQAPAVFVANHAALPRTDGETIVWIDETDDRTYSAGLGDHPIPVTQTGFAHQSPDVAGDFVVWMQAEPSGGCCSTDVYGTNRATGETFPIAASSAFESVPSVSGEWVVWVQDGQSHPGLTIMARNLGTMAPAIPLASRSASPVMRPAIDGERVVWVQWGNDEETSAEIQRLWTVVIGEEPVLLAETSIPGSPGGAMQFGSYDVAGDVVVYTTSPGMSTEETIHVVDLATGVEQTLPDFGRAVATDGRYVAFQTITRNSLQDAELMLYDLTTGNRQRIARYPAFLPAIDLDGGMLVWHLELPDTLHHGVVAVRLVDILSN